MDSDDFWGIIELARASAAGGKPFHEALVDQLAALTEQEILGYHEKFGEAHLALFAGAT